MGSHLYSTTTYPPCHRLKSKQSREWWTEASEAMSPKRPFPCEVVSLVVFVLKMKNLNSVSPKSPQPYVENLVSFPPLQIGENKK